MSQRGRERLALKRTVLVLSLPLYSVLAIECAVRTREGIEEDEDDGRRRREGKGRERLRRIPSGVMVNKRGREKRERERE